MPENTHKGEGGGITDPAAPARFMGALEGLLAKAAQDEEDLKDSRDRWKRGYEAKEARVAELEAALGDCLLAAHGQDAANNAVKRIVRDVMVKP
jgi:hypothetical protein